MLLCGYTFHFNSASVYLKEVVEWSGHIAYLRHGKVMIGTLKPSRTSDVQVINGSLF